jgi:hypothetical protein
VSDWKTNSDTITKHKKRDRITLKPTHGAVFTAHPNSFGAIFATTNNVSATTNASQKRLYGRSSTPSISATKQKTNSNTVNRNQSPGGVGSRDGDNQRRSINTANAPKTMTVSRACSPTTAAHEAPQLNPPTRGLRILVAPVTTRKYTIFL